MGYAAPTPSEMFSDATSGTEVADRFETYKQALTASHAKAAGKTAVFVPGQGLVVDQAAQGEQIAARIESITKGMSPDQLAAVQVDLDALKAVQADLTKDWSVTFPNNTGLVPYDLEAPAKLLIPRMTPLRNSIPRGKGQGTARQFKRILGWSNSGVGGVADQMAFMNSESVSTAFGPISLRRGAKITYASDSKSVAYVEQGLSDMVTWKAQFAGQGFQDIRSLSQTALLWATMGAEERALLYGRGAGGNGYLGAVVAPTTTAAATGAGATIPAATYGVKITSVAGGGESAPAVVSGGLVVTLGQNIVITFTGGVEPAGALAYNVYVGPAGAETYQGTFSPITAGGTVTITLSSYAAGGASAVGVVDSTFNAQGYDGFLSVLSDPTQTGYLRRVNAKVFDFTTPANSLGDKPWQDAFAAMFGAGTMTGNVGNPAGLYGNKLLADPDEVWVDGNTRRSLGDYLKLNAASSAYRIALTEDGVTGGARIGSIVNGLVNQVTGKMVDLQVHPYMPKGASMIRSRTLPVPDSEVGATSMVINVQDYMSVEWPVIQYTYDQSTYMYGTLVHYAPAWSGLLLGLQ
ncbi:hypothetical protein OIE66_40540 [Nonomuraea sp. NBC_01738]|uniref:hypothetical protein n=1 Tax=Nonomuraea sp. NBC_01738 TaxID=2976003 RepID=UPI002E155720|nr:hypothetical protein OIE66_40540 [Nonomuraea sp. NBC_01738]